MRQLVFTKPGEAVVRDAPVPSPGPGEVLVSSHRVGICHSDFELLEGDYIIPVSYPVVPGHEWSGQVVGVGSDVSDVSVGDKVVGECVVGESGKDHFGFSISGAAAEYFIARAEWLHRLPENVGFTEGALVEPFSVGYNACERARVRAGDRVVVLGGGPIGLLSALAAMGLGGEVTLVEPREDRRSLASELDVPHVLGVTGHELVAVAEEATGGQLFDVVIESAGRPPAMADALQLAGHRARVMYVGISRSGSAEAHLGLIQLKALEIRGIIGSVGVWPAAIELLASGSVNARAIVTAEFPLDRALDGLKAAEVGSGNVKVHLKVAE